MLSVLFLGNSHLSALKHASAATERSSNVRFDFFCAKAADLFFTEIYDGKIRALTSGKISQRQLLYFYGKINAYPSEYTYTRSPMSDVTAQFMKTGRAPEIELSGTSAIFHVSGMSPYDLIRLGEEIVQLPNHRLHDLLENMLGSEFFIYHQILEIKRLHPNCKHYLIGRPLAHRNNTYRARFPRRDVLSSRRRIRSMSRKFLFDDVYMPSEKVLDESLLETKREYSIGGLRETVMFQRGLEHPGLTDERRSSGSDGHHMNGRYGQELLKDFVGPLVERIERRS